MCPNVFAMWIGFELTVYGMGLVFLLLALLWGTIAWLVRLDQATTPPAARDAAVAQRRSKLDPDVLAAVVIACRAHRMTRRKQAAPEMRMHEPGSLPSRWVGTGRTRQNRSWAPGGRYA
jgi:Na+-transporting methylmalonyl-CoA/oxaloacetate decarboxylase gamma subunit